MHIHHRAFTILLLLMVVCMQAAGQGVTKPGAPPVKLLKVVGAPLPKTQAYFVGEVHSLWEGGPFEFAMIRWAAREQGITDVVMEWGRSEAYLFNAYFRNGDTAIYRYYGHSAGVEAELASWKGLYDECKITLHGMDFERLTFIHAVMSIMENAPAAMSTKLYAYLQLIAPQTKDMAEDRKGKKQSIHIYGTAKELFEEEKATLRTIPGLGYNDIEAIMENPTTEKHFRQRDAGMAENLLRAGAGGKRFVCIAGLGHTTLHKNSAIKLFVDAGNSAMVVNMVCRNCYTSSYFGSSVQDMVSDYEEKNTAYMRAAFDRYYDPCCYSLTEQHEFKDLPGGYNVIPTYYVLFKDQPKW